ncbi:MAG: GGDEF domain-containing protein [Pseudomonadota bacterium]
MVHSSGEHGYWDRALSTPFQPLGHLGERQSTRFERRVESIPMLGTQTSPPDINDPAWVLQLTQALQRSLHLDELLGQFAESVADAVPFESLSYADANGEPRFESAPISANRCRCDLELQGELLGSVVFSRQAPFSDTDVDDLERSLAHLVYPLRNALAFERVLSESAHDPLTGLGNRGSLDRTLQREVATVDRHGEPLTLIMFDIDHFKQVNDQHGHPAGDRILKWAAQCIRECIRNCDMAFRFGGEEFVIILSKTQLRGASLLAERLRRRMEQTPAPLSDEPNGPTIQVTASFGVAEFSAGDDAAELLARADSALYAAKHAGRNCWRAIAYPEESALGPNDDLDRPA